MKARIVQISWLSLTLMSLWVFSYGLVWLYQHAQTPPGWLARAAEETGVAVNVVFALHAIVLVVVYVCFFAVAQLIMLRRGHERFSLFAAVVLLNFGTANTLPLFPEFQQLINAPPSYLGIPVFITNALAYCLGAAFVITYPDGQFAPRWSFGVAAFSFLFALAWTIYPMFFNTMQGVWLGLLILSQALVAGAALYAQIWRYRHYLSPLQRQQVKWFVYGLALTSVVVISYGPLPYQLANSDAAPSQILWLDLLYLIFRMSIVALPLAIGIAIFRYRLWDIDLIIRRTLIYSILTALLALVYFGGVVLLQQLFRALTNAGSDIAIIISTLAIAALFNPLRHRVQDVIDHRFYRRKYDAQQVLARFAATARDEVELDRLTDDLLAVVQETIQPTHVSLWLRKTEDGKQ